VKRLPRVLIYENDELREPQRYCASAGRGKVLETVDPVPGWLADLLPSG
jgi:hypothetical protein